MSRTRALLHYLRHRRAGAGGGGIPVASFQSVADRFSLNRASNFTFNTTGQSAWLFSMWVYFQSPTYDQYLFEIWDGTSSRKAAIMLDDSARKFWYNGDGNGGGMTGEWAYSLLPSELLDGNGRPKAQTWMHLAFTFTGTASGPSLHVNGVDQGDGICTRYPHQGNFTGAKMRLAAQRNAGAELASGSRLAMFRVHLGWTNRASFFTGDDGERWRYVMDETEETELLYGWPLQTGAAGFTEGYASAFDFPWSSGTFPADSGPSLLTR
jgi:hypothetical protein